MADKEFWRCKSHDLNCRRKRLHLLGTSSWMGLSVHRSSQISTMPPIIGGLLLHCKILLDRFIYRSIERFHMTATMLVYQNKETATILMYQTNFLGIELCFFANSFVCFIKPLWPLITWVKRSIQASSCHRRLPTFNRDTETWNWDQNLKQIWNENVSQLISSHSTISCKIT